MKSFFCFFGVSSTAFLNNFHLNLFFVFLFLHFLRFIQFYKFYMMS